MAGLRGRAARGLPVSDSAVPFAALAGLAILFAVLALWRMASLTRRGWFETPHPPEPPDTAPAPRGIGGAFMAEGGRGPGTPRRLPPFLPRFLTFWGYFPHPSLIH